MVLALGNTVGDIYYKSLRWLDNHPKVNTVVVVANHIFRAFGMFAMIEIMPGSNSFKYGVSLGASLFYRLTIERFCRFRFAILSLVGAVAIKSTLPRLITIVANRSIAPVAESLIGVAPLAAYIGVASLVSYRAVKKLSHGSHCS